MNYTCFQELYQNHKIKIWINRDIAVGLMNNKIFKSMISKGRIYAHIFWQTISIISIIGGSILGLFTLFEIVDIQWYWSITTIIFGLILAPAVQRSAVSFITEELNENERVLNFLFSLPKTLRIEFLQNCNMNECVANHIISEYGKIIEETSTNEQEKLLPIYNANLLPYPKEKIKEAIEYLLTLSTNNEKENMLKLGLVFLEDFN